MTIVLSTAKRLCSARELTLVQRSRARMVRTLSDAALRTDIGRARDLRDKFKDLARSQRREQRGKVRARGKHAADGNARTVAKATLFTEVLAALMAEAKRRQQSGATAKVSKASTRRGARSTSTKSSATTSSAKRKSKAPSAVASRAKAGTKAKANSSAQTKSKAKAKAKAKSTKPNTPQAKLKTKVQPKPSAAGTTTSRVAAATSSRPKTAFQKRQDQKRQEPAPAPTPVRSEAPMWRAAASEAPVSDVHRPIPALTRRGQSLLAHDQRHIHGVKRIPRAQRRARYGHVSALGRRNQARRDHHG